jgi:hypothetical protein
MNALELLREAKERTLISPFIVITGKRGRGGCRRGTEVGGLRLHREA